MHLKPCLCNVRCHLQVMKRNSRQREEEKENGGGMMDGQMLWFIMNQLRRGRRRVSALSHMCLVAIYIKIDKVSKSYQRAIEYYCYNHYYVTLSTVMKATQSMKRRYNYILHNIQIPKCWCGVIYYQLF